MVMRKFHLRLLRHIRESKGQFIAVSMVVAVGITTYVAISLATMDLQMGLDRFYELHVFQDMGVEFMSIDDAGIEKIRKMPRVADAQGRVVFNVPLVVEDDREKVNVGITSMPEGGNRINRLLLMEGSWIEDGKKECLVLEQFAKARSINVGDSVRPQIGGRVHTLTVKGIVASPEHIYLMEDEQNLLPQPEKYGILYVSQEFARQAYGSGQIYNNAMIVLQNPREDALFKDELEEAAEAYGVKRILLREDHVSHRLVTDKIKAARQMAKAIPFVYLGVAAAIIAVMITRLVKSERTSIGVLKAMGYANRELMIHYASYAFVVGAVGSVAGVLAGYLLSGPMADLYKAYFNVPYLVKMFSWAYLGLAFVLTTVYCIAAGLWGARSILKIAPAESMRPEPPGKVGGTYLQRISFVWKRIGFSWKVVWRNVFRSRKRVLFLTLGIAISFSIAMIPAHMLSVLEAMFLDQYGKFMTMDYEIRYTRPLSERTVMEVGGLVEVSDIEGRIEYPFEVEVGWKSKVVNIVGIEPDTGFYRFADEEDRILELPKEGLLISETMAYMHNLEVGDTVTVKNFIPFKEDVVLPVAGVVKQNLGLNAYMDIDAMQRLLLDEELITGVMLDSTDDVKAKLERVAYVSSVRSLEDLRDIFKEFTSFTGAALSIYALFACILGFTIVYNATMMSINERRLEFSSLRIMGFSKNEINGIVLKENLVMTGFGILLGIPMGRGMVKLMESSFQTEFYNMTAPIETVTYVYAALLTISFVLAAQYFSHLRIKRLDFIEALKNRIT